MPRGIFGLSTLNLHSAYRGPRIRNEEGAPPAPATPPAAPAAGSEGNPPANPPANPKPEDTEGRITQLVSELKDLKQWKKDREKADKDADDEKLRKKGEYETLLSERDTTITTLTGERDTAAGKLAKYEADAQKRIDDSLKSITDAEKQKSAKAMLEGRALEDQIALLPDVMKLTGGSASNFGGPTPPSNLKPETTDEAGKQKRFDELLVKQVKEGKLSPQEQQEKEKLAKELSTFLKSQ